MDAHGPRTQKRGPKPPSPSFTMTGRSGGPPLVPGEAALEPTEADVPSEEGFQALEGGNKGCLLYTSPSPRD